MYKSLLVPLDGLQFGEPALALACTIARRAGATLHLAHVHASALPVSIDGVTLYDAAMEQRSRAREREYLANLAQRVKDEQHLQVDYAVLDGMIPTALDQHAHACGADLIVLSTHGRGPVSRFWLGSVTDSLVRHVMLPIVLVRPHESASAPAQEPALGEILVLLDGSPLAEQILAPALALGDPMGSSYTLLRVVEPAVGGFGTELYGAAVDEQKQAEAAAQAKAALEQVAAPLRAADHQVHTTVLLGQPATAILEYLHAHAFDVVALATHGRSGVRRLLLGSVADKVMRAAPGLVLIYRPREPSRSG